MSGLQLLMVTSEKRLALSLAEIEKCLDNSKELRRDARKTSVETSLALLELSMEECAKGMVLLFDRKFALEAVDPSSSETLEKISDPELRAVFQKHGRFLTPEAVRLSFKHHWMKLKQLQFVLDYMSYFTRHGGAEASIKEVLTNPNYPLGFIIRVALIPRRNRKELVTRSVRDGLDRLNSLGVETLDRLKNRALYVDLSPDENQCEFPDVDDELLSEVSTCSGFLIQLLEGMILALRSREKGSPGGSA